MSTVWFSVSEHELRFRQKTCGGGGVLGVLGENPWWKNAGE